jgi:hypothetical protein
LLRISEKVGLSYSTVKKFWREFNNDPTLIEYSSVRNDGVAKRQPYPQTDKRLSILK